MKVGMPEKEKENLFGKLSCLRVRIDKVLMFQSALVMSYKNFRI